MNNVTEIVTLLRQQAELEFRILAGRADAVAVERKWVSTRRRLIAHPEALRAVLETARALLRTPDAVSVRYVTAFAGSH
jgi:proline dehydrogenase